jgi:hypothetical protein
MVPPLQLPSAADERYRSALAYRWGQVEARQAFDQECLRADAAMEPRLVLATQLVESMKVSAPIVMISQLI